MTGVRIKSTNDILFPNLNRGTVIRRVGGQVDRDTSPILISGGVEQPFTKENKMNAQVPVLEEDSWECKLDLVTACSKVPDNITVKISPLVKRKITFLMKKFANLEWLAYLQGENFIVNDLFIPSQTVTTGSVNVDKDSPMSDKPIIGVIHSHHGMGTFFSGTDDAYINMNHNISIVVANNGMKAQARLNAPCGALRTVEAKVVVDLNVDLDEKVFEEVVDERITTPLSKTNWYQNWMSDSVL